MREYKTKIVDYNNEYDLVVIENYPKEYYHYVLLKQKADQIVRICNDCDVDQSASKVKEITGLHKGYSINFEAAANYGFNIGYLSEKFYITEAEAYFMAKILNENFGVRFKELERN